MPKNVLTPAAERFQKFVNRSDPSGCHIWTGAFSGESCSGEQYGYFQAGGRRASARTVRAHRFAWELAHGPIPQGLGVLHRCDNPKCVNPEHLFLGTQADNSHDMIAKGRESAPPLLSGTVHPSSKLTDAKVKSIRDLYAAGGTSLRKLAAQFRVSDRLIFNIVKRRTWKHVA